VSVSREELLPVLRHLGRLLSPRKRSGELRAGLGGEMGEPDFAPSLPSSQGRAIDGLSVTDRFRRLRLLAWWLGAWPDQVVAICAMAKLTVTDLRRNRANPPACYAEVVGQGARSRLAGMQFAAYGAVGSVASGTMRQIL
jgi:hypothetical protein